ncbi:actin cytoskeleton-regulatory complex protein pan1-like [Cornus florida]|uniref:actin cytoskeleton-regulatory complex protein pan1-like n=1 Tax=Cornus florida TaxID=4283 RepID=UPI00289938A0|nr:actin cytoskeleton-regulatory complex protein pan1-like [Cornus florida]
MSHHPRRILSPGASRKRKEREAFYSLKPPAPPPPPPRPAVKPPAVAATMSSKSAEPVLSNRLLAGYMAHEFLTKGTLFGQKWDPVRAEAVPVSSSSAELKRTKPSQSSEAEPSGKMKQQQQQSYAEVASLLMRDGAHIPGIVNPTQLARWIQM